MARIGVFGGTFDPIHYGHLLLAEQAREQLGLDEVRFVLAKDPPHKLGQVIRPAAQRADMLRLAIAGRPEFLCDLRELTRAGPSYTVDTLAEMQLEQPQHAWFLLIGADSLEAILTWREPRRLFELATVVAVNRGMTVPPVSDALREHMGSERLDKLRLISMPAVAISASDIRERLRAGRSVRYLVAPPVEAYLAEHDTGSSPINS